MYKPGPALQNADRTIEIIDDDEPSVIYVKGNIGPNRPNDGLAEDLIVKPADRGKVSAVPAFAGTGIPFASGLQVEMSVLANAGAFPRDPVDARMVKEYMNGTGFYPTDENELCGHPGPTDCGFPTMNKGTPPTDTDGDGMPDAWEKANGLDPNDPSDAHGDINKDEYKNIENYINSFYAQDGSYQG